MVRDSPRQVSSFRALPMRSNGTTFISRLAFEGFRADQPGAGPEVDGARPNGIPGPGVPDAPRSRRRDGKPDLPPVEGPADADIHDDAAAAPERARANPAGDAAPAGFARALSGAAAAN